VAGKADTQQKACRVLIRMDGDVIEIGSGFSVNVNFMIPIRVVKQKDLGA
jgi:hypothetical protein